MEHSDDPLISIRRIWTDLANEKVRSFEEANTIYTELRGDPSNPAFAWAALVCGRMYSAENSVPTVERFFTEAVGSFSYGGDAAGQAIAEAHLAIPAAHRGRHEAALKFALIPWSRQLNFSDIDAMVLHGITAYAYWVNQDNRTSLLHSAKGLELCERAGSPQRRVTLLSNIAVLLNDLWQHRLAAAVAGESLRLGNEVGINDTTRLHCLGNLVYSNMYLGNLREAGKAANELTRLPFESSIFAARFLEFLCRYFARVGDLERARSYLTSMRKEEPRLDRFDLRRMRVSACELMEFERDFRGAAALAHQLLAECDDDETGRRDAASCLSRCYAALGRSAESTKWKRFVAQLEPNDPFSSVLTSQIEASLKPRAQNPLTPQELECLSL